jgi:hypothetical protein
VTVLHVIRLALWLMLLRGNGQSKPSECGHGHQQSSFAHRLLTLETPLNARPCDIVERLSTPFQAGELVRGHPLLVRRRDANRVRTIDVAEN